MNFIYITIILVLNKEKQLNRLFHSLQDTHQRGSSNASKTFLTPHLLPLPFLPRPPPPFTPPLPGVNLVKVTKSTVCRVIMFATDALLSAAENSLALGLNRCPPLPQMTENRFWKRQKCTIVRLHRHGVEQSNTHVFVLIASKQS